MTCPPLRLTSTACGVSTVTHSASCVMAYLYAADGGIAVVALLTAGDTDACVQQWHAPGWLIPLHAPTVWARGVPFGAGRRAAPHVLNTR